MFGSHGEMFLVVVVVGERVLLGNLSCHRDRFIVAWSWCYCKYTFLRTFPACNQSTNLCPEAGSTQIVKYKIHVHYTTFIIFGIKYLMMCKVYTDVGVIK